MYVCMYVCMNICVLLYIHVEFMKLGVHNTLMYVFMYVCMQSEMERIRVDKIEPTRSAILTWSRQLSGAAPVTYPYLPYCIEKHVTTMFRRSHPGNLGQNT